MQKYRCTVGDQLQISKNRSSALSVSFRVSLLGNVVNVTPTWVGGVGGGWLVYVTLELKPALKLCHLVRPIVFFLELEYNGQLG